MKYALEHGMINVSYVQEQMEMNKRKELLEKHPYKIWEGKDGNWHTYLSSACGRTHKKRKKREDIEMLIVKYWESEAQNTFINRYRIWIDRQKKCGRTDNTISKYESNYKRFFSGDKIENMQIGNISDEEISEYILRLLSRKSIPYRALKEMFGYLNGVFEKAKIDKVIKENPCQYIDLQIYRQYCIEKVPKRAEERTLSKEDTKSLMSKVERQKSMARFAVELAVYTGMRVGELAGLKWSDIDFTQNTITISRSEKYNRKKKEYYISTTKNDKSRTIPLTENMKDVLRRTKIEELKNGIIGEYVFTGNDGERVHCRTISEHIRNITMTKEFSGVKSIHAIRRTVNSNLKCAGVPTPIAAALLGHTEKVNEENYTYDITSLDEKRKIMESINIMV